MILTSRREMQTDASILMLEGQVHGDSIPDRKYQTLRS